jgi:NAD(P)-dependent dehydrogenase (short-subunit alcohol dehydrogenase family)
LNDKIAIITGATGGIGAATAELFLREGARVLLVDLKAPPLEALAQRLGERAAWVSADVSSEADTERYVSEAVRRFGGVDVLFANAGIEGVVQPLTAYTAEDFDRVLAVNVRGVWLGIKYAAPEMAKRGGGSIVVTSSVAGLIGSKGLGVYVASKHAIIGLAKTAALELAAQKIRVNTLNPGPIENRMMRSIEKQANPADPSVVKSGFEHLVPLGRYGTNEEMAQLALFLASADSSYCTGSVFVGDGGFTAS